MWEGECGIRVELSGACRCFDFDVRAGAGIPVRNTSAVRVRLISTCQGPTSSLKMRQPRYTAGSCT